MDPNVRAQVPRPLSADIPPQGPWPYLVLPPLLRPQRHSPVPHTYLQPYIDDMPRYPSTPANVMYAASPVPFLTQNHSQQQSPSHGLLPPLSSRWQVYRPIAPAPLRDRRPECDALPSGAISQAQNRGLTLGNADGLPSNSAAFIPKDPPRTRAVGSQGQRGILPSVPRRAAAITNGANGMKSMIPAKDADGKFLAPIATRHIFT
ncbi:hypothetical protein ACJ73_04222 [Blastomyces percursus]|uniref:Uncharacterized protein n=1 Tax=Blastomyces percursus TaxID=1658174 RepID=A0A1J9Q7H3_9EURO|nr:hypothetical protein ACJ73_04222 [Blastomyces percursus]